MLRSPERYDAPKLGAARLFVVRESRRGNGMGLPYLAPALYALQPVASDAVPTMAVDARLRLYVNPSYVDRLSVPQLAAVLVHEVNHVLRHHPERGERAGVRGARHRAWNVATDCEINDDLRAVRIPLPGSPLLPDELGLPSGDLAELYLRLLALPPDAPPSLQGPGSGADCGSVAGGGRRPGERPDDDPEFPGLAPAAVDLVRARTAAEIVASAARWPGSVPAGLRRWAQDLVSPSVDWRRALRAALARDVAWSRGHVDYTYRRPSRRGRPGGIILPTLQEPSPTVAVVIDTSGSMDAAALGACLSEIGGILRAVGHTGIVPAICCDAAAGAVQLVRHPTNIVLEGGGGTDMEAGLRAAESLRPRPDAIVVLTDGMTRWPSQPPYARTIVGVLTSKELDVPGWATGIRIAPARRRNNPFAGRGSATPQ